MAGKGWQHLRQLGSQKRKSVFLESVSREILSEKSWFAGKYVIGSFPEGEDIKTVKGRETSTDSRVRVTALAGWLSWLECWPKYQKFASLMTGQAHT